MGGRRPNPGPRWAGTDPILHCKYQSVRAAFTESCGSRHFRTFFEKLCEGWGFASRSAMFRRYCVRQKHTARTMYYIIFQKRGAFLWEHVKTDRRADISYSDKYVRGDQTRLNHRAVQWPVNQNT